MSTQKEILNFQIRAVDLVNCALQTPKENFVNSKTFSFNISVEQKLDHTNKCLIAITHVEITTGEDLDYKLATASVSCLFSIENYNEIVKVNKSQVTISPAILEVINSISFSTTRGVLSQFLKGTYLHNAILPVIDPKTIKKR